MDYKKAIANGEREGRGRGGEEEMKGEKERLERWFRDKSAAVQTQGPEFRSLHPHKKPGVAGHTCRPSTVSGEAGGSPGLTGHRPCLRFSERWCLEVIR